MLLVVEVVLEVVGLVPLLRSLDVAALVGVVAVAFRLLVVVAALVGVVFPFVVFVGGGVVVVAVAFRLLVVVAALVGVVFPFVVFVGGGGVVVVVAVAFRLLVVVAALVGVAVVFVVDSCTLGTGFTAGLLSNVTPFK
jgi:hypothetical protein